MLESEVQKRVNHREKYYGVIAGLAIGGLASFGFTSISQVKESLVKSLTETATNNVEFANIKLQQTNMLGL